LSKDVQKQKIGIPITNYTFEAMLNYLLFAKNVNARFLRNIIKLMDALDRRAYEKDQYIITVQNAIDIVSKMRYDGVSNSQYIKNALQQSVLDQKHVTHIFQKLEPMEKAEYDNLGKMIRDYVDYTYLFQSRLSIMGSYDELMNSNGKMIEEAVVGLKQNLEDLLSSMRRADVTREDSEAVAISAHPSKELKSRLAHLYDDLTDPRNIFKTGLKELNRILNGGVRRKGMLIIYGPTNSFKSGTLLYFALWILQFNPGLKSKIPGKKLAVVIVTMENTDGEELERIHAIYTQGLVEARSISKDTWLEQWDSILGNLNNDIELRILYKNPIDTTTIDIQAAVEELEEDQNLEVMAVIIDHLGNIKSRNRQSNVNDWRDTVQIAYELSDWAKSSNRALITAMHTNSSIDDRIAEAIAAGKTNLVRMLGRHCIADAKYIDRAVDLSIYIYKEYSNLDGKWYLGFKYEKQRGKRDRGSNVFYHPLDNDITLQYDEGLSICRSFPCIPGTENTIQMQQMAMVQGAPAGNGAMPIGGNPFTQNAQNPFAGRNSMMNAAMAPITPPILNSQQQIDFSIPNQESQTPPQSEQVAEYIQDDPNDKIEDINDDDFKDDEPFEEQEENQPENTDEAQDIEDSYFDSEDENIIKEIISAEASNGQQSTEEL
jgi:hypothetical protein